MADGDIRILRGYELRLLRCTVSSHSPPESQLPDESRSETTHPHDALIRSLLSSIEAGDYLGALASEAAGAILGDPELELVDSVESAERVYSEILDRVESFVVGNDSSDEIDKARRAVVVMCLAISSAFWFTRCNLTG